MFLAKMKDTYRGLDYAVVNSNGYFGAYLNVEGTLLERFGAYHKYDGVDDFITVHGGVTFGESKIYWDDYEAKDPIPGAWIGWDYAHKEDYGKTYKMEDVIEECKRTIDRICELARVEPGQDYVKKTKNKDLGYDAR